MPVAPSPIPNSITTSGKLVHQTDQLDVLVQARLGVYTGLFYALRAKHPPSAAHGLRVALGCSKWAEWRKMSQTDRQLLEVAALLHDIGKIGVPDRVLQKPAHLDGQEQLMMEMQRGTATEMLQGAGASQQLIDIVRQAREGYQAGGELQQITARMLAVVDAFDSMTTEQVFRKALSRERAIDELFRYAGSQFDPELVHDFAELLAEPRPELESRVTSGWLVKLSPTTVSGFGCDMPALSCSAMQNLVDSVFHHRLLDTLPDAAVYLDIDGQILSWNRAAERMTGRQATTVVHSAWTVDLMGLLNEDGSPLLADRCPLQVTRSTSAQTNERLQLKHVDGRILKVNLNGIPVFTGKGEFSGVILVIRDTSAQVHLEERVQSLNVIASQDNLTKVSNRAELDRRLPAFLQVHTMAAQPGSLIICDIDHFKRINDTYGHQAGDDALVTFAKVLRECSREGDLVARYGGEEFVLLCAACDNPTATARAEEIRRLVERTPVPALNGNTMTASFGVTENQPGDTAATLIARADRALLTAKSTGRNRVVQLGAGQDPEATVDDANSAVDLCPTQHANWLSWFRPRNEVTILSTERLASVPHAIAIQKLEGFISDHGAEVLKTEPFRVTLRINGQRNDAARRSGERQAAMIMDVTIKPVDYRNPRTNNYQSKTKLEIVIRSVNPRDRRQTALLGQANQLLASFNSYLVAQVITDEMRSAIAERR
jgi:diguanylate cyclase (GGDEF)-like protein/PAS domain S-box-containing protein